MSEIGGQKENIMQNNPQYGEKNRKNNMKHNEINFEIKGQKMVLKLIIIQ